MTQDQVDNWSQNPDQYVADEEEETFSVRVSGELVLDELLDAFPEPAVAAVADAVYKRFQEADQAKVVLQLVDHSVHAFQRRAIDCPGGVEMSAQDGECFFRCLVCYVSATPYCPCCRPRKNLGSIAQDDNYFQLFVAACELARAILDAAAYGQCHDRHK